jgi:hypothetical protein
MKPWIILLVLLLGLSGCLAGNLSLPRTEAGPPRFQQVLVVAMEPPPLMVPPRFEAAVLGYLPKYPIQAARVGGVLTSVAILAEMPAAARRSAAASKRLEELLSKQGPWEPTMIMARAAASQLSAHGQPHVAVRPEIKPIPGLPRGEYSFLSQNWLGPIRDWYAKPKSTSSFEDETTPAPDAVVETAILNYEITPDYRLSLQIMVKVVEPATGQVIGRARASDDFAIGQPDQALAKGGRQFKEIFAQKGNELIAKCLKEIGMI